MNRKPKIVWVVIIDAMALVSPPSCLARIYDDDAVGTVKAIINTPVVISSNLNPCAIRKAINGFKINCANEVNEIALI